MLAINPKIKQKAEDIRKKIFGAEVRESLASGLEGMSEDVESIKGRQGNVENQFQDVLDETTGKDVINGPEIIAARNGKSNLKTRLDDEHAQVTAQLQQTMTQTEFDSWVATLLDGGPSIFMETKSALDATYPNGSSGVALVRETDPARIYIWNGSAWQDFGAYQGIELKDRSATFSKRTELGNSGLFFLHGSALDPAIDTTNKVITFYPNFYIKDGNKRYTFSTQISVGYLSNALLQYLVFDTLTSFFRIVPGAQENTLKESELMILGLNLNNDLTIRNIWFTNQIEVDGEPYFGMPDKAKIKFNNRTTLGGLAMYSHSGKKTPIIDNKLKNITFYGPFYLTYGKNRYSFTSDITVPIQTNALIQYVIYNVTLNSLRMTVAAQENLFREDDILVMVLNLNNDLSIRNIFFTGDYSIDGEQNRTLPKKHYFPAENIFGDYTPSPSLVTSHMNAVTALYAKYDALLASHPDYLTQNEQGLDESNTYSIFKMVASTGGLKTKNGKHKPQLVFTPGIHGGERNSVNAFYYFMEDLCNNWMQNPVLEYIRHAVDIIFTPVANPHAYQHGIRANANGVDINRNFSEGHQVIDSSSPYYGGAVPFSERETRIVRDLIQSYPDALIYCDFHTNGSTGTHYHDLIWHMINTDALYRSDIDVASISHIEKMTRRFKTHYDVPSSEPIVGFASYQNLGGSASLYGGTLLRNSMTIEVFNKFPDEASYSSERTIRASTDAIGNWIVMLIKQFKD